MDWGYGLGKGCWTQPETWAQLGAMAWRYVFLVWIGLGPDLAFEKHPLFYQIQNGNSKK